MIECPCGFGKNIEAEQENCHVCGINLGPLHRLQALPNKYYEEGIRYKSEGKIKEAREMLCTAVALNPDSEEMRKELDGLDLPGVVQPVRKSGISLSYYMLLAVTFIAGMLAPILLRHNKPANEKLANYKFKGSLLVHRIKDNIERHESLKNFPIRVEEKGGSIMLVGNVPTPLHCELIDEIAKHHAVDVPVNLTGLEVLPLAEKHRAYYLTYTVQNGDTLALLAKRFYGNPMLWPRIVDANNGKIKKDNTLLIGQVIYIPITRSEK